jgi:hypothetical protein
MARKICAEFVEDAAAEQWFCLFVHLLDVE